MIWPLKLGAKCSMVDTSSLDKLESLRVAVDFLKVLSHSLESGSVACT
jgi:hypothetical protein